MTVKEAMDVIQGYKFSTTSRFYPQRIAQMIDNVAKEGRYLYVQCILEGMDTPDLCIAHDLLDNDYKNAERLSAGGISLSQD